MNDKAPAEKKRRALYKQVYKISMLSPKEKKRYSS